MSNTQNPSLYYAKISAERFLKLIDLNAPDDVLHVECLTLSARLTVVMRRIVMESIETVEPDPDDDSTIEDDDDALIHWQDRLVFDHNVSTTSPVVKGTNVTAAHLVSLVVEGWSWDDLLRQLPEINEDDIRACLAYSIEAETMTPEENHF